jgi:hypothetical protein
LFNPAIERNEFGKRRSEQEAEILISLTSVIVAVAWRTESDQIGFCIVLLPAAKLFVMYLQVLAAAAVQAAPAVTLENLPVQCFVGLGVEANPVVFWADALHDAFWPSSVRNSCF